MSRSSAPNPPERRLGDIILVEDDPVLAMTLEATLLDAGASCVRICATTDQALAALRERKPDALVVDVHLRDRDDGWAIAELVDDIGPKPPTIVFSTGDPDAIPRPISDLGSVLKKPYDPAELVALLQNKKPNGLFSRLRRRPR